MMSYENMRRLKYGKDDAIGIAVFIPVCEICGRFVKADPAVKAGQTGLADEPNATCSKCGRTQMLFEGFF
jgi:ribosomal protein L32